MQCGISQNLAIPCGFNSLRHLNQGKIATEAESKSLYAGVDYNLTLCPLQSRLQHIYHGQPYARVDFIPQSGTLDLASESTRPDTQSTILTLSKRKEIRKKMKPNG
jgi:hypothetical protein